MMNRKRSLVLAGLSSLALIQPATIAAKVDRVVVESVTAAEPVAGAPVYEIVSGHFAGTLDPLLPGNAVITDIAQAPRNAQGLVEYSATFKLARPIDKAKASGVLFYGVPNRGNFLIGPDPDGHVRLVSGWQGDLPKDAGLQTVTVPVARGKGRRPLTGPVLVRFQDVPSGTRSAAITGSIGRPTARPQPVSLDARKARLFYQTAGSETRHPVAARDFAFADCSSTPFPGTPDPSSLCLRGGFDAARAYTLVYTGKDPLVLGIGFAATRDLVAHLRRSPDDVAGAIRWTVASGTSQSGNFLKSFVNLGFNADEAGRIVFDGINPNIAARQVPLNLRFGVPGGAARAFEPGSEGTLWWSPYNDRVRGLGTTSLLDRCALSNTCPKVIETFGSAEFWGLRMAPGLIGTDAARDVPLPANVRRYYFPSVTHGGSWTGGFKPAGDGAVPGCKLPGNPNPSLESLHAAQAMLVDWVRSGTAPKPSAYPTIAGGELVQATAEAMGWRGVPGTPHPARMLNRMPDYRFGKAFRARDVSGSLSTLPPEQRGTIPQLVPRVNDDGNETAGIPSVQLQVPLGTYLGWNETTTGFDAGSGCSFIGGFVPFAKTRAERLKAGDMRASLEERYGNRDGFLASVRAAVARQQAAGWLLPRDAERLLRQAEESEVLR